MVFHENWYSDSQLVELTKAIKKVEKLKGKLIEIGCWEGKSTVVIANVCFPENLDAVDTWKGNINEDESSVIASRRDVYQTFKENVKSLTEGNVTPYKQGCFTYLSALSSTVKFCHIDASHMYQSVKKTIEMLLPKLVNNAILCGDDYQSANLYRKDLDGGVKERSWKCAPCIDEKLIFGCINIQQPIDFYSD